MTKCGEGGVSITDDEVQAEPMPAHKERWPQQQLMARIITRHVDIISDVYGIWPAFVIQTKEEDDDIHQILVEINLHLSRLDWVVSLHPDDPWIIQVLPTPVQQFPSRKIPYVMWTFALFSLMYAAETWMSTGRPEGGWFHSSITVDGFIGYALPILSVIFIASSIHKRIAASHGIRVPHLFPVFAFPALWWPFGLLGVVSIPRMDARIWPDRASLGWTAISAPLTMIIGGLILVIAGINLTPELVALSSMPLTVELPLLVQMIGLGSMGEHGWLLVTSFVHPLTFAGATLLFFGWVSLIPLPTFPGGRLLMARMGVYDARSGSTQMMLLFTVLLFSFLYGAFASFSIWTVLILISAILLITRGGDPRLPIILDDAKGLSDNDHRRLGLYLFLAFILMLPAQIPFAYASDWDEELQVQLSADHLYFIDDNAQMGISFTNIGLIQQNWSLEVIEEGLESGWFENPLLNGSGFWSCEVEGALLSPCQGITAPDSIDSVSLVLKWNSLSKQAPMTQLRVAITTSAGEQIQSFGIASMTDVVPLSDTWNNVGTFLEPRVCISLHWLNSTEVNTSIDGSNNLTELFTIDGKTAANKTVLSGEENDLCLEAPMGTPLHSLNDLFISFNNSKYHILPPKEIGKIIIPEQGLPIYENDSRRGWSQLSDATMLRLDADVDCPIIHTLSTPASPKDGVRVWDMLVRPEAKIPVLLENDSLLLKATENSIISSCSEGQRLATGEYEVVRGPELILINGADSTRFWTGYQQLADGNLTFYNPGDENISVSFETLGAGERWSYPDDVILTAGAETVIPLTNPGSDELIWIDINDSVVEIKLINHEV
jgi:hypothetical protein